MNLIMSVPGGPRSNKSHLSSQTSSNLKPL